jgi:hypothetical protein
MRPPQPSRATIASQQRNKLGTIFNGITGLVSAIQSCVEESILDGRGGQVAMKVILMGRNVAQFMSSVALRANAGQSTIFLTSVELLNNRYISCLYFIFLVHANVRTQLQGAPHTQTVYAMNAL